MYKHTQVTETNNCRHPEETFRIDAGIDISGGDVISLSAGVGQEWTSGTERSCQGDPGDTVSQWLKTAYMVFEIGYDNAAFGSEGCGSDFEAKYPNTNSAGGEYYRVTGERFCRSINSAYCE